MVNTTVNKSVCLGIPTSLGLISLVGPTEGGQGDDRKANPDLKQLQSLVAGLG